MMIILLDRRVVYHNISRRSFLWVYLDWRCTRFTREEISLIFTKATGGFYR